MVLREHLTVMTIIVRVFRLRWFPLWVLLRILLTYTSGFGYFSSHSRKKQFNNFVPKDVRLKSRNASRLSRPHHLWPNITWIPNACHLNFLFVSPSKLHRWVRQILLCNHQTQQQRNDLLEWKEPLHRPLQLTHSRSHGSHKHTAITIPRNSLKLKQCISTQNRKRQSK